MLKCSMHIGYNVLVFETELQYYQTKKDSVIKH